MLRKLRIRNFKGWQDTGDINMAPITLFFGANSSGKSSIGQFLMMLRQTIDFSDRKAVFYSGGNTSAVQLGTYQDMVYSHDSNKRIEFEYVWDFVDNLRIKEPGQGKPFVGNRLEFDAEVGTEPEGKGSIFVDKFRYALLKDDSTILSVVMSRKEASKSKYQVKSEQYPLKRNMGRAWALGSPVRFYGFPDEVVAYYQNADFVQSLNLWHENLFRSIFYLGPLRIKTERLYSWTGNNPESVGFSGENAIAAMLAASDRRISTGYKKKTVPFQEIIASKLKEMNLIEEFRVSAISEQRQEYEVKVRAKGSHEWVDLPDVGFGISQVLPVLVQCFYAPPGSIIIMEQPEIHLHPAAQAALADVMIDVVNSRENGEARNIQLIIETHSEHFLRRIQRRIAEADKDRLISRDSVSAYFAAVDVAPAKLETLKIDLFGNILNWPHNFFGDEMGDITAQATATMKRILEQSSQTEESENEEN